MPARVTKLYEHMDRTTVVSLRCWLIGHLDYLSRGIEMADDEDNNAESKWKYRASIFVVWIVVLLFLSAFILDNFPSTLPIWGDWRFFLIFD